MEWSSVEAIKQPSPSTSLYRYFKQDADTNVRLLRAGEPSEIFLLKTDVGEMYSRLAAELHGAKKRWVKDCQTVSEKEELSNWSLPVFLSQINEGLLKSVAFKDVKERQSNHMERPAYRRDCGYLIWYNSSLKLLGTSLYLCQSSQAFAEENPASIRGCFVFGRAWNRLFSVYTVHLVSVHGWVVARHWRVSLCRVRRSVFRHLNHLSGGNDEFRATWRHRLSFLLQGERDFSQVCGVASRLGPVLLFTRHFTDGAQKSRAERLHRRVQLRDRVSQHGHQGGGVCDVHTLRAVSASNGAIQHHRGLHAACLGEKISLRCLWSRKQTRERDTREKLWYLCLRELCQDGGADGRLLFNLLDYNIGKCWLSFNYQCIGEYVRWPANLCVIWYYFPARPTSGYLCFVCLLMLL